MTKITLEQLMDVARLFDVGSSIEEISVDTGMLKQVVANILSENPPAYIGEFWAAYTEHSGDYAAIKKSLLSGGSVSPSAKRRKKLTGKKFVLTSAQNNTEIHRPFFDALQSYCDHNESQLIIGQYVYNKNGFQNGVLDSEGIYYADELKPFFLSESRQVAPGLVWCGELNILPTAKFPLSGLESYTGACSSIVPHARIALESVATAKHLPAKMLFSTGTVTQHNYIAKKAGQVAEASHCYGALVVEVDDTGQWYARQIQTDESGSFQDLLKVYHPDGSVTDGTITAVNLGDIHAEKSDPEVLDTVNSLLRYLRPEYTFLHDLFDFESRNHHNRNNPHFLYRTFHNGQSVEKDLESVSELLAGFSSIGTRLVVVESNHDLALEKWLSDPTYDFRKDPVNAAIYLELQHYIYVERDGDTSRLLAVALEYPADVKFLDTDQSFMLHGIEFGVHGHVGINGSRGNPKQFMKLNQPMNTGHTHSASIHGQVYTAGVTGSLDMGYNVGPSSWSHSHIVTYGTGQRAILTLRNGRYWA